MSKKRTRLNPNHPHTMLKMYLARKKKELSQLSNLKLAQAFDKLPGKNPTSGRSQRIKQLLRWEQAKFKGDWLKQFGWPFDDSYDKEVLQAHIEAHRVKSIEEKRKLLAERKKQMAKEVES